MTSESSRIIDELNRRQHRGEVRGADAVFDAAWDEAGAGFSAPSTGGGRQSFWLVAAGLLVLLIGGGALLAITSDKAEDETVIAPAACTVLVDPSTGLGAGAQGALADDPVSMLCPVDGTGDNRQVRDLDVITYGEVEARVVEIDNGERTPWWVAELIPFPNETSTLAANPASKPGGAIFPLGRQAGFSGGALRVETELVTGHVDHAEGSSGEGHWVIVTPSSDDYRTDAAASSAPAVFASEHVLYCSITGGSSGRLAGCGLLNPDGSDEWTTTFFTDALPSPPEGGVDFDGSVFTQCDQGDSAAECLDSVTFEFEPTSVTVLVNGERFFRQADLPRLPDELLEAELSVWWGVSTVHSEINQIRFHGATGIS